MKMNTFKVACADGHISIPKGLLELCGLQDYKQLDLIQLKNSVAVIPPTMTAMELVEVSHELVKLAAELRAFLVKACGKCRHCMEECEYTDPLELLEDYVGLPDFLLEEAELPKGTKLCALTKPGAVTFVDAGYEHDLRDIPPVTLDLLWEDGICMRELEEILMLEETVYGK